MFAVAAGLILTTVIVLLSLPFWVKNSTSIPMGADAALDQERIDLDIERQTLLNSFAELELDLSQGRFEERDYHRLKAIDEHRLVGVLEKIDRMSKAKPTGKATRETQMPATSAVQWVTALAVGILVIGTSSWIFSYLQAKEFTQQTAAGGGQQTAGMPNPAEMVARLESRLKENPDDLDGQMMAGRSYMALERMDDAWKAWTKVLELDSGNHEAHYSMGLMLLQTTPREDRESLKRAFKHFDTALIRVPREPAVLWYHGVILIHFNRYSEADKSWTEAFQNLNRGSEDSEFVKEALQNLRNGRPPLY